MSQGSSILLFEQVFLFSELFEPVMLQGLTCCYSVIRIVDQQLLDEVLNIGTSVRYQLSNTGPLNSWEIELHMGSVLLEVIEQRFFRGAQYVMNFVNLIHFIFSWKQRKSCIKFCNNGTKAPNIDCCCIWNPKDNFWCSVKSGLDICVNSLSKETTTSIIYYLYTRFVLLLQ